MKSGELHSKIRGAIPCSLLLCFTFFVFGPLQLYISNRNEFWFKLEHILPAVTVSFLVTLLFITVFLTFLPQRINKYVAAGIFGLGFALYIQGNFINYDYGVLDGTEIDWSSYGKLGLLNTLIWILCVFTPVILSHFWTKQMKKVTNWIALSIVAIQVITSGILITTAYSPDLPASSDITVTEKGMFSLSKEKNLVVFVMDSFDASYMNEVLEKRPEYKELFDDFTFYSNTLGGYPKTKGALPHILTGKRYDNSISYFDYLDQAFEETILFKDLTAEGYDAGVYTSARFLPSNADACFINVINTTNNINANKKPSSYMDLGLMMYKATAFTYFPHALKDKVWYYTGDFNKYIDKSNREKDLSPYVSDNVSFYEKLVSDGLLFENKSCAFRFYHLDGAHAPYNITEDVQYSKDGTSPIQESLSSLNIVLKYIELLKQANVYDNTSIVIMADHGSVGLSQNPVLMIKQAGTDKVFSISSAPISFDDIVNTFLYLATDDFDKYQSNVFTWKDGDYRERSYWYFFWDDSMKSKYLPNIYEYVTAALASDSTNMVKTGKIYTPSGIIDDFIVQAELGETLKFGNKGKMLEAALYGFSSDEKTHVWNSGSESELVFQIKDKVIKDDRLVFSFKFKYMLGNSQRIRCFINGVFIDEKSVNSVGKPISFIVPTNIIDDDGRVQLRFDFPDARPIGEKGDNRTVALAFDYLVVDYYQGFCQRMKVGNEALVIDFSKQGNSDILIDEGWHEQEEKYRWTSDKADIVFYTEVKQDYLISIVFQTYKHSGNTHVLLNNKEIAALDTNSRFHKERVVLPKELLNEDGIQKVTFITDEAKSPLESGTGKDSRILGIGVKRITIETWK